jgi:hypothetical protein
MTAFITRLRKETGIEIEQYEVWHNEENLKKMREYDKGLCGGVPFFINTENEKYICGETSYEELKKLALRETTISQGHSPAMEQLDYSYITDGIYIGTNQCCQTHFDERLKKEGIEADISLEENHVDAPFGVTFYIWMPVKNSTAPTQEQLHFGVSILEKFVNMKKKMYVHCKNGHGRAPTLVAAYLIKKGKSVDEAIATIKAKRPFIHIENGQRDSLEEFSRRAVRL